MEPFRMGCPAGKLTACPAPGRVDETGNANRIVPHSYEGAGIYRMNQDLQTDQGGTGGDVGFAQIDADAVCEQCSSVNDEGTLLCKVCGQNLRDQRARRLANAHGPEMFEARVSRIRLLTGLLSVFGLLLVVFAVLNLSNIEASLVTFLSASSDVEGESLWSGPGSEIYDNLLRDLEEYPTSRTRMEEALENPVTDRSYNGRYVLMRPGRLDADRVIGEANLSRRGDRVYFVAKLRNQPIEIRGYASLEQAGEDDEMRVIARNTVGITVSEAQYTGFGFANRISAGGHRVVAASDYDNNDVNHEVLAYRVR